jgi:hypothetical protein
MAKKIKITEAGIADFFKSFFRAKADGKEKAWLNSLNDKSPELADIWKNYDDTVTKGLIVQKTAMEKLGLDSSHIDAFAKGRGIKL